MEVIGLKLTDLDAARRPVVVRQGKGNKDRMVLNGERAVAWRTVGDLMAAVDAEAAEEDGASAEVAGEDDEE